MTFQKGTQVVANTWIHLNVLVYLHSCNISNQSDRPVANKITHKTKKPNQFHPTRKLARAYTADYNP